MNNLRELQDWIISEKGLKNQIESLVLASAAKEFSNLSHLDINVADLDWDRLLFSASLLTKSEAQVHLEIALRIAHAGIILNPSKVVLDASLILLNSLSNQRAIALAEQKELVATNFEKNLGFSARIGYLGKKLDNSIFKGNGEILHTNSFQLDFWEATKKFDWIYASAPTAAGKTYIVFQYILEQLRTRKVKLIVYIAPTRALVSEVERELAKLCEASDATKDVKVHSIPLARLYKSADQTILVFTQERLHLFLNAVKQVPTIEMLIVDEAHKIGEGMRGVILQEAIERVVSACPKTKVLFLSPPVSNPGELLEDKPTDVISGTVKKRQPMVNQNLIYASQLASSSKDWKIEIIQGNDILSLGNIRLSQEPNNIKKRIAFIAAHLSSDQKGILIYANGPAEAEEIGLLLMQVVSLQPASKVLYDLQTLAKEGVHKDFRLVTLVKFGIGFHYGNMPSLLREKIEDAFNKGELRFLICTATLVEGVNLSCRTIFVRGPKKGNGNPMMPQDFWNLAGRAGRWGREFQGNIVCIDPSEWTNGVPQKSDFELERQTEKVLRKPIGLIEYLGKRTFDAKTIAVGTESYEEVFAFLLVTFMREGSLSKSSWSKRLPVELIAQLDTTLSTFTTKIDIPVEIVEKHSGVSAVAMQTLLDYFRKNGPPKGKDGNQTQMEKLERWIPVTPDNSHAFKNMSDLLRRITLKLFPAFGPRGRELYCAVLILNWMRGYPLPRIIQNNVDYFKEKKQSKTIHAVIRETMKDVEEIARFKAPKYIACYIDIIKFYLTEIGRINRYADDHPFDLYLEFCVMSETFISLMLLGLSRMTAVELGNKIADANLSEQGCLKWLSKTDLTIFELPAFAMAEIKEKLETRLIN